VEQGSATTDLIQIGNDDLRGGAIRPASHLGRWRRRRPRSTRSARWWPFAIPALVLLGVFFVLPFVLNVRFAFTDWSGFQSAINWTGLDNFSTLNHLGLLWPPVEATLKYAVIATIVQNTFSLGMALLLHETTKTTVFFRALYFVPVLIAPVAAGYIWHAILAPNGPLNAAIGIFSAGFHYDWLGHATSALVAVASIDAWRYSGLVTLVYVAGLNAIPRSLTEAAKIDGANAWRRFWHVRFRLLAPAFTFSVVVTLLGSISAFDVIQATTMGGPGVSTTTLNVVAFQEYGGGFFGLSTALSLTVTILVVLIAIPLLTILRRREVDL
jgi:multiple sugar transport system permease protein/raffinose/stachyose/melibiose transport system permease protein